MKPIAWMGGTRPNPWSNTSKEEKDFCSKLFRGQLNTWCDHWQDKADLDLCRTFWKRARYDAHATFREFNKE